MNIAPATHKWRHSDQAAAAAYILSAGTTALSLSAPSPPDPTQTADAQQGYNEQAAKQSQQLNMINQSNPYGSLTYQRTGTNPDGTPIYSANTTLSAPQQGLLNTQQQNQGAMGQQAGALTSQLGNQYAAGMNTDQSAITNQLLGWQQDYMQPYFTQQQSNLNSQLAAQGITQGSQAYNNAQNQLGNTQGTTMENAMATDQNQAYSQALQNYTTPIQMEQQGLSQDYGSSLPASVTQNLINTPTTSEQPADYSGIAEQNYASQNSAYQSTLNGLFGIPTALVGGWAMGGGLRGGSSGSNPLGSMGSFFTSDRRMKSDIEPVGALFDGTRVYRYRYKSGGPMQIGVMAQDIEGDRPEAVVTILDCKLVDYERATERAAELARAA